MYSKQYQLIFLGFYASTAELVPSTPCEYITDEKLLCRQTSFIDSNIPLNNKSIYSHIKHIEWIESGAYILSNDLFHLFSNLKNVSLRSNTITSLSILPFWHHLKHIYHLDLSQNRLISINNRDFQLFHNLISLNISFNFLTAIEPIWLLIPLQIIDLSQNGINTIGYMKIQNSTSALNSCLLEQIYLNDNRGLLSFIQLQTTIMNVCPFVDRFQLVNNHWHCACSDLFNSLKHYRTLILIDEPSQTLTGQCETPLPFRNIDIQKMNEELACNQLVLFDSILNEQSQSSPSLFSSRQIMYLFIIGCIIGVIIGLCLHYCVRRCHDLLFYILFKCNRQKVVNERHPNESVQMADTNHNPNHFIYCPTIESDSLPSYSQVMNDIFYLDIINRQQHNEPDGEC
ncbi:unnamed protein product [Rotaria sordida]|uniref:Uncharacterized protein n=1 Tax=Rotaria sordida TaxID=392033 RepID=A0A813TI90_9BILA|nr:unnamed protein product [Rotaria sordida]CAF0812112.1 unnamed protein product [Rotaria sordida]